MKATLKMFMVSLLTVAMIVTMVGCAKTEESAEKKETINAEASNNKSTEKKEETSTETANEPVTIQFWHAMGGDLGEVLGQIVTEFNDSQGDVVVEAVYQGSYDETLTKFKASAGTDEEPAIFQCYEIGTKYLVESGYITPMQSFIDAENHDISELEPALLNYYKVDGKLNSMPFNSSNAILFYNKDMFKTAGLDADKAPQTYSELIEAAEKLTIKKGDTVETYGFSMLIHSWFFEQLMANKGATITNNDNGRTSMATEATFNSEAGVEIFEMLDTMYKAGSATSYGSTWADIRSAFIAGNVAMYMDSTAGTASNIKNCDFEVGTAFMPYPDGSSPQGAIVGGGSLWITAGVSDEKQAAAWEFIKFMHSADQQAFWHVNTGYFPSNVKAYETDLVKENIAKYPQFQTAVNQLQQTTIGYPTQGAYIGVFPEVRVAVQTALENVYNGIQSPQEALDEAAATATKAIEIYNKTAGK